MRPVTSSLAAAAAQVLTRDAVVVAVAAAVSAHQQGVAGLGAARHLGAGAARAGEALSTDEPGENGVFHPWDLCRVIGIAGACAQRGGQQAQRQYERAG